MASLLRTPPSPARARADDLRAARTLFRAVFGEALRALGRYRLGPDDRRDLAHRVVLAAFQRWDTYRHELGSPRRWLRGIVLNEVRVFRREQGKPGAPPLEELGDLPADPEAPEDVAAEHDLLDRLLAELPHPQRQAVVLHDLYGFTLAEIAVLERTSVTRAHARRAAGMKALREAAERFRRDHEARGVAPVPLSVAGLCAAARAPEPPPAVLEAAWRRVVEASPVAVDDPAPESGAPRSEAAPARAAPPLGAGSVPGWPAAGLVGAGAVAGVILGVVLGRAHPAPPGVERPSAILEPAPASVGPALSVASGASGPSGAPSAAAPSARALAAPAVAVPGRRAPPGNERLRAEQALLDRGYAALDAGNLAAALGAVAEHRRRFPDGQHGAVRDRLQADACKRLRRHPAPPGAADPDGLCP